MDKICKWYMRHHRIMNGVVLAALFFLMAAAVTYTPYRDDDFFYMNQWGSSEKIRSFNDVIYFQQQHYLNWGGRTVSHTILQLLFLIGKPWSSLLTAGAYFLLAYFIARTAADKNRMPFFFLALGSLWILNPAFNETVIWYTGAANYLWTSLIVLASVQPALKLLKGGSITRRDGFYLLLMLPAGWCNENISSTLFLFLFFELIWFRKKTGKVNAWLIASIVLCGIGCGMMLLAPGNFVRAEDTMPSGLLAIAYRGHGQVNAWFNWLLPAWLVYFSSVYCLHMHRLKVSTLAKWITWWAAFSILIMAASPSYPERAVFGSLVLLITAIFINCRQIYVQNEKLFRFLGTASSIGLAFTMLSTALLAYVRDTGVEIPG